MDTTAAFTGLRCTGCGERVVGDQGDEAEVGASDGESSGSVVVSGRCPDCDAPLDADYDYDALAADLDRAAFAPRPRDGVWAVDALLPFPAETAVSVAEGATPLVLAPRLTDELGVAGVLVKDEGRNPTGTVLDRGFSVAVTAANAADATDVAVAEPGDGGQSMGSYAGRAGMRPHSFTPSRSTFLNKAMTNVHGGEMRVVGGRYPDAVEALADGWMDDWTDLMPFTTPYRHEGQKSLAWEVAAGTDWDLPDALVVPTGTGEVLYGVWKGFRELAEVGLVEVGELPRLYAAQPDGCAPIATAWERSLDVPEPWGPPDTICGELEVPDPPGGSLALDALAESEGGAVAVDDEDALEAAVVAGHHEGLEVSVNAGIAFAGAWELADEGAFDGDETVVLVNREAGVKTADLLRSHLMGQGV
ncbi:pyridoxal-phosphate dependent enzyme [Halobium salinum]|uniref:Pyridoxal-phosphate dependent enzyme n=1 Tax=Halobium salinum TaxID=1364940 RepID=A0ABD5PD02_9EURY|nr:pyridoxal-phosphate dependent enzyme [Halobium salinum]